MPDRPTYARDRFKPKPVTVSTEDRRADKRFYAGTRWRKVRATYLGKNPLCAQCLHYGQTKLAEHVHHIKPRKTHPHLAYDESNLQGLCKACHNQQEVR